MPSWRQDQTPPSPQLWMSVNQNWACIVQKSFLKRSIEKLKLFSRSCDVWENWKHSRVYLGLVPDGCNSLQFPPLFNTVSPPTFTAHVPFWPPSSPPAVFCESFIFSGHQPRLLSKLMPNYKNTEALLKTWLNLSDSTMAFRTIIHAVQYYFWVAKEYFRTLLFILISFRPKRGKEETEKVLDLLLVLFSINVSGVAPPSQPPTACMPWWATGHKSKNESGLLPPLPPASAYITVWTPVQVLSGCV